MDTYQDSLVERIKRLKQKKKEYKAQGKDVTLIILEIHHIEQALWFSARVEDSEDE